MISIIINVYNGEKYIKKCLNCIINQTYKDLEIIIVNDASLDNTLKICQSYKDKRIKIINNKKNIGLSLSRNIGIENAKGEFLYFIDVDDFIELDTIEYLYNLCIKYNAKMATCKTSIVRNNIYRVKHNREKIAILSSKDMLKKIFIIETGAVAIWNKLINKELFNNLRFDNRISDDIAFTHKIILKAQKIVYSNQYKYFYLKNPNGICSTEKESFDRTIDMYYAIIERYNYIKKVYPNFIENNIGVLEPTAKFYLRKNFEIINELNRLNAVKLYNKLFSLKILKTKLGFREKIKLILFRINPNVNIFVVNIYLKIMRKSK